MKSFKFNRKKEDLLPVMKAKAEKANIKMTKEKDKISLMLETIHTVFICIHWL